MLPGDGWATISKKRSRCPLCRAISWSEGQDRALLDRLDPPPSSRIADLAAAGGELSRAGCRPGRSSWRPGHRHRGWISSPRPWTVARRLARERHLDHRVRFTDASVADRRRTASSAALRRHGSWPSAAPGPPWRRGVTVVPPGGRLGSFGGWLRDGVPSARPRSYSANVLLGLPRSWRNAGPRAGGSSTGAPPISESGMTSSPPSWPAAQEWLLGHGADPAGLARRPRLAGHPRIASMPRCTGKFWAFA